MISVIVPVRNGMPWLRDAAIARLQNKSVTNRGRSSLPTTTRPIRAAQWHGNGPTASDMMRVVDASHACGPGGTRNAGVVEATGDMLAFCDADDVVQPGWLRAHVAALADADISAGVFDYWSLNEQPAPSPLSYAPPPAMTLFRFLPAAGSGNLAIRRYAFEELGGFADDLKTGEDFDLSWRSQLSGHRFVLNSEAVLARRDQKGFTAVLKRYFAYGRCGPMLFRRFQAEGLHRDLALAAKTWVWLIVSSPRLVRPEFRDHWARTAGWRAGRLIESARLRILFL